MRRIAISLDEHAHAELSKRAHAHAEPLARTAARFVRDGLLSANGVRPNQEQEAPPAEAAAPARAAWLEPEPHDRERWRRETWAAVCALQERYSKQLAGLPRDWWADRSLVEQLAALCAWRAALDAGCADDPRSELLFHDRLDMLRRQLGQRYEARFEGGAPPAAWAA